MDKVDQEETVVTDKKVHKNKSSRLIAQESQRSLNIITNAKKSRQAKAIGFSEDIKSSKPLRRSFVENSVTNPINNIQLEEKTNNTENEEVIKTDYATKTKVDNIKPNSDDEKIKTLEQESPLTTQPPVTSLFQEFPSIIEMAQKFTTAIPTLFTSTASAPITTTTATTTAPVRIPTEVFTLKEAVLSTEGQTISPSSPTFSDRAEARASRGRFVSSVRKVSGRAGPGERRKLFGQKVVFF